MGGLRRVGAKPTLRRQPRLSWNLHTGLASQHLHCQHNLNQNTTNPPTPPLQLKNKSATNSLQPNPHFATVSSRLPFKTTFYELISLLIQILLSPLQCQVKGEILKDLVGYPEAIWTGALVPRPWLRFPPCRETFQEAPVDTSDLRIVLKLPFKYDPACSK